MTLQLPDIQGPVNDRAWAIEGVPADAAAVPWRRCWTLLARAVARFPDVAGKWTSEALLCEVMSGQAQLWVAWSYERRRIEGVVVTRIFDRPAMAPNDKVCECPLAAGVNMAQWGAPMLAMLKAWARAQNCDYIAGYGRRGWKRLFGFTEMGTTEDGLPILIMPLRGSICSPCGSTGSPWRH
ncbi:hypothetical protein [Vineibacter terrae]|uniref:hypothetical protein n=1 Tax=Vineibacter terrae TaxID=2586908 RepID=UPI002E315B09|nr:hypothetical protein [Vineibacter terrae]HEX2887172.1 hypothetical protein [Vineibacter terrae]